MQSYALTPPPIDLGKSEVQHTGAQGKDWLIWPEIVDESIRGMSCIWALSLKDLLGVCQVGKVRWGWILGKLSGERKTIYNENVQHLKETVRILLKR